MKFSIAILPIIAALGMASVMDEKSTAKSAASSLIDAASPKAEVCCNTTPCFVGCPVNGAFALCC